MNPNFGIESTFINKYSQDEFLSLTLKNEKEKIINELNNFLYINCTFKDISEELWDDEEIVQAALNAAPIALKYASDRLKNDINFIIWSLENAGGEVCGRFSDEPHYDDFLEDDFECSSIADCVWKYAGDQIRDSESILDVINGLDDEWDKSSELRTALSYASPRLRNSKTFMTKAVKLNGLTLEYASTELINDKGIVLEALKENPESFMYAGKSFRDNPEIVLLAVKKNGVVLEYATEEIKKNKNVVLEAVQQKGRALKFANINLQNDKDVVLEAVKQDAQSLKFAHKNLQKDKEVVLEAVKQDGRALEFANKILQNNKDVVLEATKNDFYALNFANRGLLDDYDIALASVKNHFTAIHYISDRLLMNEEIAIEALASDCKTKMLYGGDGSIISSRKISDVITSCLSCPNYLEIQSKFEKTGFKADKAFAIKAVSRSGGILQLLSKTLQNDKEVVLEAVKQNGLALKYASENLRSDKPFLTKAISLRPSVLKLVKEKSIPHDEKSLDELASRISRHSRISGFIFDCHEAIGETKFYDDLSKKIFQFNILNNSSTYDVDILFETP